MGIIPKFMINHRASQNFEKEDRVYDCAHLHDFSRKNRILPFISWKPIEEEEGHILNIKYWDYGFG